MDIVEKDYFYIRNTLISSVISEGRKIKHLLPDLSCARDPGPFQLVTDTHVIIHARWGHPR